MSRDLGVLLAVSLTMVLIVLLLMSALMGELGRELVIAVPFVVAVLPVTWAWYALVRTETRVPAFPLLARFERSRQPVTPAAHAVLGYLESLLWGLMTTLLTGVGTSLVMFATNVRMSIVGDDFLGSLLIVPVLAVMVMWPFVLVVSPFVLLAWRWTLVALRRQHKAGA